MKKLITIPLFLLTSASLASVPPPPPAPELVSLYKRVATPPTKEELSDYILLFSPSVKVIENDKLVAEGQMQLKSYLISNTAWEVKNRLISYDNPVLAADSVYLPTNGCCLHTRFGVYHFGADHLVDEVRFTTGGTFWDGSLKP